MNAIERTRMLNMIDLLNRASEAYYSGNPIMSDEQFDIRLDDLRQLEKETGIVFSNSPTQTVGARILTELPEVVHSHEMLSLEKCHSANEVVKFGNNKELVASIKLDGLTVSLTYDDGILVRAETRGDGHTGTDITEHIKQFLNVPLNIEKDGIYVVDGEAIITDGDFNEINKSGEYKNSRNLAAGTLSVLDTSLVAKRRLRFIAWDIIEGGNSNNLKDNLSETANLGFDVVSHWAIPSPDEKKIQATINFALDYASDCGFPNDGVVFKFNDIEYGKSLGKTSHHFKNGIAYKPKDDVYRTKLIDIEWSVGKSGTITPIAVFEPVDIDGAIISRSTVHNVSILTSLDLHIGDTIEIYRANQVIPAIKRNVSADERISFGEEPDYITYPEYCPICGGATKLVTQNNSTILVCTNNNCKGKLLGRLTHFVSKNAMDIDGMSESTIEKFIKLGWLTCFEDIYKLRDHFKEIVELDGFGVKSTKRLLSAIEHSKTTTLDRFIYAMSIPLVGRSASKTISKYFNGDFERFYKECVVQKFDYRVLDSFGDAIAESIDNYLDEKYFEIGILSRYMIFEKPEVVSDNSLEGKVFCITGTLSHFENRDEAKEKIESLGGKVVNSVSAKTSFLVCNEESNSSKYQKAQKLGIKIISEDELIKMTNR